MVGAFWRLLIPAILACVLAGSVQAGDDQSWGIPSGVGHPSEPGLQFAIGAGHRLGGDDRLENTASLGGAMLLFLNDNVALKLGLDYNNHTRFLDAYLRTTSYQLGLRMQSRYRVLSPFFEAGFAVFRYEGNNGYLETAETKPALVFAIGLSISTGSNGSLDLTLEKSLNHVRSDVMVVCDPSQLLPPDDQSFVYSWGFGPIDDDLYNPAQFQVRYRFGL